MRLSGQLLRLKINCAGSSTAVNVGSSRTSGVSLKPLFIIFTIYAVTVEQEIRAVVLRKNAALQAKKTADFPQNCPSVAFLTTIFKKKQKFFHKHLTKFEFRSIIRYAYEVGPKCALMCTTRSL